VRKPASARRRSRPEFSSRLAMAICKFAAPYSIRPATRRQTTAKDDARATPRERRADSAISEQRSQSGLKSTLRSAESTPNREVAPANQHLCLSAWFTMRYGIAHQRLDRRLSAADKFDSKCRRGLCTPVPTIEAFIDAGALSSGDVRPS
jgi:hypothetical protein